MFNDEIIPYIDANGQVQPQPCAGTINQTGNGLSYTGVAICLAYRLQSSIQIDAMIAYQKCVDQFPGLINRSPQKTEQEGMDDYILMAAANQDVASNIEEYGKHNYWNFNNVNPGKLTFSSFFGRSPIFVAHIKRCANSPNKKLNFIYRFINNFLAKSPQDKILAYHTTDYKISASDVAEWIGNPNHPIVKYWVN